MDYKVRTRVSRILMDDAIPVGSFITVLGWVRTVRISKAVAFIQINDGSCVGNLQALVQNEVQAIRLRPEDGRLKKS